MIGWYSVDDWLVYADNCADRRVEENEEWARKVAGIVANGRKLILGQSLMMMSDGKIPAYLVLTSSGKVDEYFGWLTYSEAYYGESWRSSERLDYNETCHLDWEADGELKSRLAESFYKKLVEVGSYTWVEGYRAVTPVKCSVCRGWYTVDLSFNEVGFPISFDYFGCNARSDGDCENVWRWVKDNVRKKP